MRASCWVVTKGKPCGRPVHAQGLCDPHYLRFKKWGDVRAEVPIRSTDPKQRLLARYRFGDDCWLHEHPNLATRVKYAWFDLEGRKIPVLWDYADSAVDCANFGDGPTSETYAAKKVMARVEEVFGRPPTRYGL